MGLIRSVLHRLRRSSRRRSPKQEQPLSLEYSAPPSPAAELERVFRKFDSNGDGRISSDELAAIFDSLGHPAAPADIERMMKEADTDGDGFISLEEFVELNTSRVDPAAALEDLRHAFSVFDLDRNGSISAEELALVMRGLGEPSTVAQCKRMIDGVDQDGDGQISFEEFKVMMQRPSAAAFVDAAAAAVKI